MDIFNSPAYIQAFKIVTNTEDALEKYQNKKDPELKTISVVNSSINFVEKNSKIDSIEAFSKTTSIYDYWKQKDFSIDDISEPLRIDIGKQIWANGEFTINIYLKNITRVVWRKGWMVSKTQESEANPADIGLNSDVAINGIVKLVFTFMMDDNKPLLNKGEHKFIFSLKRNDIWKIDTLFIILFNVIE